jgi:hypothetical protein
MGSGLGLAEPILPSAAMSRLYLAAANELADSSAIGGRRNV